jgi:uncharacterized membrane protein
MRNTSRATKLMIFATIVATLRFMLLHGVFAGYTFGSGFKLAEMVSGIAFAALEGIALAYISRRWRKIEPQSRTEWFYWSILLFGQIVSLVAITWTIGIASMVGRRDMGIQDFLSPTAEFWWSLMVAGLNPLILLLIGIVEDEDTAHNTEQPKDQRLLVLEAVSTHGLVDPGTLAQITNLPIEVAARELGTLHTTFNNGKVVKNGK